MKRALAALLGAAAALAASVYALPLIPAVAQGTSSNPLPGSVWTYLGATFGAGWLPPATQAGIASSYGVDLTGGSDSTTGLQNCLNAGIGRCLIDPGGKVLILGNLTIPPHTTLDCQAAFADNIDANPSPAAWTAMPSIRLDGGHTISAGGEAAALKNCLVYRNGMTFPVTDPTTYPNGSTAFNGAGYPAPTLENDVIMGFDTCVNVYGSNRVYASRLYVDCNGNALAAFYGGNDGDIGYYHAIKVTPAPSTVAGATCAALVRPGAGFYLNGSQAEDIGELFVFLHKTGIKLGAGVVPSNPVGAQEHQIGQLWVDYVSTCPTAGVTGLVIDSGAKQSLLNFSSVVLNTGGLVLQNGTTPSAVHFDYLYTAGAASDAITVGNSLYDLTINHLVVNGATGYALNYIDTAGTSTVAIEHAALYNIHGNVAPLMNITPAAGTAAGYRPIEVRSFVSNTPTLNLFQASGTGMLQCLGLAVSGASLTVPSFPNCFALTGSGAVTALVGGVWPGREVIFYVAPSAPITFVQGGNIALTGGATFTPNTTALQSIAFRCEPNSPTTLACREMWRGQ